MTTPARLHPRPGLVLPVLLAVVALLGLMAGPGAGPAAAHDVLLKTSPADGATVERLPDKVVLTFDNPALALGTELQVTGPKGQVQQGKPVLVDNKVSQAIAPGSPAGDYTVVWRVTSQDGHPVSGKFAFTAQQGNGGEAATPSPGTAATPTATGPAPSTAPTTPTSSSVTSTPPAGTPVPSGDDASTQNGSGGSAPWIAGVVAVVIVLGGGALVLALRRKE